MYGYIHRIFGKDNSSKTSSGFVITVSLENFLYFRDEFLPSGFKYKSDSTRLICRYFKEVY